MTAEVQKPFTTYRFESSFSIAAPPSNVFSRSSDKSSSQSPKEQSQKPEPAAKPKRHDAGFSFVNVVHPNEARGPKSKRAIRSHVARVQHSRVRISSAVTKKAGKARTQSRSLQPRPAPDKPLVRSGHPSELSSQSLTEDDIEEIISPSITGTSSTGSGNTTLRRNDSLMMPTGDVELLAEDLADFLTLTDDHRNPPPVQLQKQMFLRMLSGNRSIMSSKSDPFWSYPVDYHPSYERALDFYVVNIAVDMDFLTPPGQEGNLRKQWIPLTMTDPAAFYAIMLMAATAYSCLNVQLAHAINLMALKGKALAAINQALSDPKRRFNDATIAGIMKMASYEAAFGNTEVFHAHMDGLERIVRMRGGLPELGWDGLLERMILWVDTNASHALGCGWKFDEKWTPVTVGHPAPDPLHFSRCVQ
ncbi:hypothetical protein CAC42_6230 [Sphaceloma murrayae]|uniref:Uncharacterized protein n=1 Tax=Sphaceloma murrayae TaxID=2082308 RepID=A0A2K1QU51_9PEZI|nr:hypothetical protein CAC42_6230 [Sphaceloma murrayae]